jgi:hypothetical protein
MSYGAAAALQRAVYDLLQSDPALQAKVAGRIYDAAPPGEIADLYVTIGPEQARDRGDMTGRAARHDFSVTVVTSADGFHAAKDVAATISDALVDARPPLSRGRVVRMDFVRASALRAGSAARRRIDMRFSALVAED